jgi:C-3',4' desaturase CrtD
MKKIVVIGAGIAGLTAAAHLASEGLDVTVLEAHIYPGGCAGTFYHQGYQFDAGATLAGGFYPGGPMELVGRLTGIENWPVHSAGPEIVTVHLPDGAEIIRWADEQRWAEHRAAFGRQALPFWQWQERTADALWSLALRLPPWPLTSPGDLFRSTQAGFGWLANQTSLRILPEILKDALQPVAAHLKNAGDNLRLFVDAQLLISAQSTSESANALYGAAALDLPRRGVVHPKGGMGSIARRLAQAVKDQGGEVHYRQEVTQIRIQHGRTTTVETKKGDSFPADLVIANLPPWNIVRLLKDNLPPTLKRLPANPRGWGAFTVYLGLDENVLSNDQTIHHQIIRGRPLGEGNTAFLSISPAWDHSRAPTGYRAATLSTHTSYSEWWELYENDPAGYEARKEEYTQRLLLAAERAVPGLRQAANLIIPGTPVSFQRFTRRVSGWVGGFPQTSLLKSMAPRLSPQLWMVGDSIFPGQSTAAAALGGLRVAREIALAFHLPEYSRARAIQTEIH